MVQLHLIEKLKNMETNSQLKIKSIDPRIDSPQIKVSYPSLEYAPIKELPSVLVPVQAQIETAQNTTTLSSVPSQTVTANTPDTPTSETKSDTQNTGTSIVNFFKEHTGIVLLIGLTAFLLGVIYSKNKS